MGGARTKKSPMKFSKITFGCFTEKDGGGGRGGGCDKGNLQQGVGFQLQSVCTCTFFFFFGGGGGYGKKVSVGQSKHAFYTIEALTGWQGKLPV